MIINSAAEFQRAWPGLRTQASALPKSVFMVLPEAFHLAAESATDNAYMETGVPVDPDRALRQAEALAKLIEATGVPVQRFPGHPDTPDAVFPNNVFATAPGRFIVGAMRHPVRRREAERADIRAFFAGRELVDLSTQDLRAELTGSLVIDRARLVGFCGMSSRVDQAGLEAMHAAFGLRLTFAFDLQPSEYHTNVVLSVLVGRAVVLHPGSFVDPAVVTAIQAAYPGRVLLLDEHEKQHFAGNCIALTDSDLFMSEAAASALRPASLKTLERLGFRLRSTPLDEIEKAGGSLRCMVGEVF